MGSWTMVNELATFKLMSISNYPGKIAYLFNGGWEDVRNSKTSIPGMNLSCSMDSEYYYSRLMHHHVGSAFAVERIFFWGGGWWYASVHWKFSPGGEAKFTVVLKKSSSLCTHCTVHSSSTAAAKCDHVT